jgi:hypothetical protein
LQVRGSCTQFYVAGDAIYFLHTCRTQYNSVSLHHQAAKRMSTLILTSLYFQNQIHVHHNQTAEISSPVTVMQSTKEAPFLRPVAVSSPSSLTKMMKIIIGCLMKASCGVFLPSVLSKTQSTE